MKGYWDHKGKPSMFVVKDGDKEIYRGGFKKGYELLMNTEPKNNTIEYLRKYNEWRRGADTEQPDPKELGEQIDAAIAALTMMEETAKLAATLRKERDEAQATLTDIHRWIERNHPDGFIDSMTFHQNLERVGDRWYDRLDIVERERDEAREEAGHWKTEYEIVVDRLRGRKHPRDNGIIADDEIIPKLERERDEARGAYDFMSARAFEWEKKWLAKNAENAKLRDIADRAIVSLECRGVLYGTGLRADLDQLKEGGE